MSKSQVEERQSAIAELHTEAGALENEVTSLQAQLTESEAAKQSVTAELGTKVCCEHRK